VWEVRPESPQDADAIARVHIAAFAPSLDEAALVDALRASRASVPELCLVALLGEEVAGHVAFSRAQLASGHPVLVLAPMGVLPSRQGRGAGSALVAEGMRRGAQTDAALVVVLGRPTFYARFGFEPVAAVGVEAPFEAPGEAWMAHRLSPAVDSGEPRGRIVFPEAFRA
jgi:putative acetyltransferase